MRYVLIFLALLAALSPTIAAANEIECFGGESRWCGKTASELHPELIWSVSHRERLPGLIVEIVVDSVRGTAGFQISLEPIPEHDVPRVLISLREPGHSYADWRSFQAPLTSLDQGTARFLMERRALEALMMASKACQLYVFVEVSSPAGNLKLSHKIGLDGLLPALRFARLGK